MRFGIFEQQVHHLGGGGGSPVYKSSLGNNVEILNTF